MGYYKEGQPTDLWQNDDVAKKIPSYKTNGFINNEDVYNLMRPLVGKAADLGQYIPTKMPPLTLRDLGETKDAGVDVLKRYRKNLPYFLSSPASMEDMFGALQRKPSGSRLRDLYEVHPDGGGQVAQIIKYIAGEAPKESPPNPLENVPLGMYGKDQVDDIVKSVHEASEKQLK